MKSFPLPSPISAIDNKEQYLSILFIASSIKNAKIKKIKILFSLKIPLEVFYLKNNMKMLKMEIKKDLEFILESEYYVKRKF
jgi:hypothetical protein